MMPMAAIRARMRGQRGALFWEDSYWAIYSTTREANRDRRRLRAQGWSHVRVIKGRWRREQGE